MKRKGEAMTESITVCSRAKNCDHLRALVKERDAIKAKLKKAKEENEHLCITIESTRQDCADMLAGTLEGKLQAKLDTAKEENERLREQIEHAIECMDEEPAKEILEQVLKCKYFEVFKWAEPPLEPGENATPCSEERCNRKTGNLATDCWGDKEICEFSETLKGE